MSSAEDFAILEQVLKARSKCATRAWVYAGVVLLGAFLSYSTYSAVQHQGGTYYVFWGAIIFGGIACIRNIYATVTLGGKLTELQATMRRPAPTPSRLAPPLLRQLPLTAPAAPTPSPQAAPSPSVAYQPDLEAARNRLTDTRNGDVPESEDDATVAWVKMAELLTEPAPTGPDAPDYSWDYVRTLFERAGNELPPLKAARLEYQTRLISISIAALAKTYYDADYAPDLSEENFDTEFSIMCTMPQPNGSEISGFLVRHDEGLGFFDGNDLFNEDIKGTPILLPWPAVKHVYLGADPGIWPIIDREKLGNVSLEALSGKLTVAIKTIDGKTLALDVKPHVAFSDPAASRFVSTLEFLYRVGTEVPA